MTDEPAKLPPVVHALCGWPLALIFVGGAIGGALGGAAYGINVVIYKSRLPTVAKVVLNVLTGAAAIGAWFAIALALRETFNR